MKKNKLNTQHNMCRTPLHAKQTQTTQLAMVINIAEILLT